MGLVELQLEQNRLHQIFEIDNRDQAGTYEVIEIAKRKASINQTNSLLMLNINTTRDIVKQALTQMNTTKPNFCIVLHDYDTEPFHLIDLQ